MSRWNGIRRVSKKQAERNKLLRENKKKLRPICVMCGRHGYEQMHLLPRSLFPEHYTNPKNLAIGCSYCHNLYDNNLEFRQKQKHLYKRVQEFDKAGANRYFQMDE